MRIAPQWCNAPVCIVGKHRDHPFKVMDFSLYFPPHRSTSYRWTAEANRFAFKQPQQKRRWRPVVNFYFTAKRYIKHLSVKPQDAEVTALRKVVCPDVSRVARVPASPFPSGTYIQPQQCIREKQTSKGDVGKPISQGASGRPRKPKRNSKHSFSSLPRYLTAKGDHAAQQHQGDNTHS